MWNIPPPFCCLEFGGRFRKFVHPCLKTLPSGAAPRTTAPSSTYLYHWSKVNVTVFILRGLERTGIVKSRAKLCIVVQEYAHARTFRIPSMQREAHSYTGSHYRYTDRRGFHLRSSITRFNACQRLNNFRLAPKRISVNTLNTSSCPISYEVTKLH